MSDLRIYAETAACLLNTGPEVDHDTDAIRRSMKEEVLLYYDPGASFLRCYVQVQRAQPEQFAFEYEHDGDGDVFESFVREAREEVEKTNWRIIDENSAVFTALETGADAEPETDESDVKALLEEDESIEFAATDRKTAVGLVAFLRETFGDEHSIAISRAGRVDPVADADFVIVPDQSYTGLTRATKDRLERVKVGYWRGELEAAVDAVGGTEDAAARLAAHVDREGITDRFDVEARPATASWTAPAGRWLGGVGVAGVLVVTAYLLVTRVTGRLLALLTRDRLLHFPPDGAPAILSALQVDAAYPSWLAVASAGVAVGGGLAAVGAVPIPSVELTRAVFGESDTETTFDGAATSERGVGECLDRIVEAADRETAVEALTDALGDRGVEILPNRRARLYRIGVRALGAGAGVAVVAGFYVVADGVLTAALNVLSNQWSLVLDVLLTISVGVLLGGVGSRLRSTTAGTDERPADTTPEPFAGTGGPDRRSSAVSRQRIRRLLDRADDADYLKREVDPKRLLDELKSRPDRKDIAALLRAYEQAASVTVVPPNQRHLVDRSSGHTASGGPGEAGGDAAGTGPDTGSTPGTAEERPSERRPESGAGSDPPPESGRTAEAEPDPLEGLGPDTEGETEPDTPPETDRDTGRETERASTSDTASEERDVEDVGDDTSFTFGAFDDPGHGDEPETDEDAPDRTTGTDTDEEASSAAGATRGESTAGFPTFRYDDANSGYVRGREYGTGTRPTTRWEYHTDAEPLAPVVADGTVYVVDRDGGIYAVDETGEQRWTASVDGAVKSSPAVYDDTLYFGSDDGTVYAIDTTGDPVWSEQVGASTGRLTRGHAAIITPPAVVDGTVYVGDVEGYVHARDARTGREAWRKGTKGAIFGKPAVRDGTVFVANDKGLLTAYGTDGDRRWSAGAGDGITTVPAMGETSWYVVDGNGVVHRLDPTQGGAEVGTYATGSTNPVSPTVGDGRVFLGTRTGSVVALDADLQASRWKTDTDHGDRILAPFVLDERYLYVAAGRHVYALDPANGGQHWSFRLKDEVNVQPAYACGSLFVATESGRVHALGLEDA